MISIKDKYLDLARELNIKAMENEDDGDINYNWKELERLGNWTGRFGNWRTSLHHSNYSIAMIGLNTKKSPRDLKKLTLTQTPVKDH